MAQAGIHVPVHRTFDPALLEHRAANRRVALDLAPVAGFLVDAPRSPAGRAGRVGADVAQHFTVTAYQLQGCQRWPVSAPAEVSIGEQEPPDEARPRACRGAPSGRGQSVPASGRWG